MYVCKYVVDSCRNYMYMYMYICNHTVTIAPFTRSLLNQFASRFRLNHLNPFTLKLLLEAIQGTCKRVKSVWELVYVNNLAMWFEASLA